VKPKDDAAPLGTTDLVVLLAIEKRSNGARVNVNVRGTSKDAERVRREIRIVEGRAPGRGTREVMVGSALKDAFVGVEVGSSLRLAGTDWPVVGIFDAGRSAFSSEVWGDVDIMLPIFRRENFSSVTFRLANPADFERVRNDLEADPRLSIKVSRERSFYASQSKQLALFIRIIGVFVTVIFSVAAVIGCTITMHSSVAQRVREIGILRALGFSRSVILRSFLSEAMIMALLGGIIGILLAWGLSFLSVTTTNFSTFSELTFGFVLTPSIAGMALVFSVVMGFMGAVLPAWQASRKKVLDAIRAS
jgi:ABC-type antimicrobial peptide transport system permease subunit